MSHASAQETGGPGRQGVRLDLLCGTLLLGGGSLLLLAPFQTSAYYIDWISGAFFGAMVGVSEGYLTVIRFHERLRAGAVSLRCRRGVPEGAGSALTVLAMLALGMVLMVAVSGSVAQLTKIPLYVFNTLCGAWGALWVVYLAALLSWALVRGRRLGRPLRVRCAGADERLNS